MINEDVKVVKRNGEQEGEGVGFGQQTVPIQGATMWKVSIFGCFRGKPPSVSLCETLLISVRWCQFAGGK